MVSRVLNLGLRAWEFLMAFLIMALVGNMIHDATAGNPAVVNFDMFCAVFAMLSLFYLGAVAFNEGFVGHPMLPLALDVLNALFWFCAAVAMAAKLGVHNCGNKTYTKNNVITNGADDRNKRCTEAQASTAFLWFGFVAFLASAIFSGFASGGANLRSGGIRRGGPAMSQV